MNRNTLTIAISYFFILLFLYTGLSKLMDYTLFKEQISSSHVLEPIAAIAAWLLPGAEMLVALLLFIPRYRIKGLYATIVLMVVFTGYIITIMALDNHLPCSCGGIIELLSWKQHLIFNLIALSLAIFATRLERSSIYIISKRTIV